LPEQPRRLPRQIVEEHRFVREWSALFSSEQRADEALDGLKSVLETLAEYGLAVPGLRVEIYGWPVRVGMNTYRVFYRFTNEQIFLLGVGPAITGMY
jgi:hypothetical protein